MRLLQLCGLTEQELEGKTIYKSVGCNACSHTGYRCLRGIFEYMEMNTELRELAFSRSAVNKLRIAANATGMRNLLGDGKLKILDGETTLEEIARTTQVAGVSESSTDECRTWRSNQRVIVRSKSVTYRLFTGDRISNAVPAHADCRTTHWNS